MTATLPGLSQGQACDMQGPYSRVCAPNLACSLCPENTAAILFTCVGTPSFSQTTPSFSQTTVAVNGEFNLNVSRLLQSTSEF